MPRFIRRCSTCCEQFKFIAMSAALISLVQWGAADARGECSIEWYDQNVVKTINSYSYDFSVRIYLVPHASGDWGDGFTYGHEWFDPCPSEKTNCDDEPYEYMTYDIDTNWSVTVLHEETQTSVTCDIDDAENYWDHYYYFAYGYTKVGSIDYSMNCHGYSTGFGDCIQDGQYGIGNIVGSTTCWTTAESPDSDPPPEVGVKETSQSHSIKVTCSTCDGGGYAGNVSQFTKTSEKFRDSAIYERTATCPAFVLEEPDYKDPLEVKYDFYARVAQ